MSDPQSLSGNANEKLQYEKSAVQIRLLKGPVFRATHRDLWQALERDLFQIREYFQQIGLSLVLDDAEGYAFLRQIESNEEDSDIELPRLITRRRLTFHQTLLLVLLRKRLAEHDSEESAPRLTVDRSTIHQWLSGFVPETSNQVKQHKDFDALIKKTIEMGFLSPLKNSPDDFEVQRILKALIHAEQIGELIEMLSQQQEEANND
tara:strand:- start:209 stop:826 length:618 start_codon:yes stop_codon:yes gene_type:complete